MSLFLTPANDHQRARRRPRALSKHGPTFDRAESPSLSQAGLRLPGPGSGMREMCGGGGSGWFCCSGEGPVSTTLVPMGTGLGGCRSSGCCEETLPRAHTPTRSLCGHHGGQAGADSFQKSGSGSHQPCKGRRRPRCEVQQPAPPLHLLRRNLGRPQAPVCAAWEPPTGASDSSSWSFLVASWARG